MKSFDQPSAGAVPAARRGARVVRVVLLVLSLSCFLASGFLTIRAHGQYQAALRVLPAGTTIAGVPVGGLDAHSAGLRLAQAYGQTPIELRYSDPGGGELRAQVMPEQAGFALDLPAMLAEAAQPAPWSFSDYLLNQPRAAGDAPLRASLDEARLAEYLNTAIAPQLGQPPAPARPAAPGELTMRPGQPGQVLDVPGALSAARQALFEREQRVGNLQVVPVEALPAQFADLEMMLEAVLQSGGFEGTIELYLQDSETGQEVTLAYAGGRRVPPGVAFTAASTIKIPVMVSAFRRIEGELSPGLRQRMELMIDLSDNGSTDEVMQATINDYNAPLLVSEDMQALGLQSTFLAGFFAPGAALLDRFDTPANTRPDVSTDPDIYNQTTAAEMGKLLGMIETCAAEGRGPLIDAFTGQVTQAECQLMVEMLKKNRKAVLIEAGLPEGTPLAHKYGWVTDFNDGLLHTASDAGIVYTPGRRFALSIFLFDPNQLNWDNAQLLVARLARAAVNFYN